ncbi:hypothetical protein [Rhizobium gallicum]|uniref:hypothetical protein n=1 Tax=Rhizobium gallicum TaxID=56730 RepID=UPI001EF91FCE|nr:hypothetical protein [Rhizobium gallicum]ULJ74436.1 hypothetical protein L2W42_21460 [Rhizobium gallicum]
MLHAIVKADYVGDRQLWSGPLLEHRPVVPLSQTANDMNMRDGGFVSASADSCKLSSAGVPTLGEIAAQNNGAEPDLRARLGSVDIYAVGALLHSLNLEWRDSARLDRQAARDCDIAAQDAAAKALRASGLFQLTGTILTSTFAIAGAGVTLKGATKAQVPFQEQVGGSTALRAQQTTMLWSGVATGITEVGKIAGAASNMGATMEQEKKARLEAESIKMRSRAESESEFKTAYEKMIQDVLEKLSEVRRAESETRSKVANMG